MLKDITEGQVKTCKRCNKEIVWLKSQRTGRFYPVNTFGILAVHTDDFHRCGEPSLHLGGVKFKSFKQMERHLLKERAYDESKGVNWTDNTHGEQLKALRLIQGLKETN